VESSSVKAKPDVPMSASTIPSNMRKRYELLDECRELIIGKLGDALNEAVRKVSDSLTAAATTSGDSKEQEMLLEAASVVRANQMEIASRFQRSFKDVFERRLFAAQNPGEEPAQPEIDMSQLTLMSDDDVNSRLAVEKIVHRSKTRLNPDDVLGMRARMGALLDRDWFDEDKQPASPADMFDALKSTLAALSPTPEVAGALLNAFEPYMSSNLNDAYIKVNQRLVAHQILPKIRPVLQRANNGQTRTPKAADVIDSASRAEGVPQHDGMAGSELPHGAMDPMFMTAQAFQGLLENLQRGMPIARQQTVRMLTDEASFGLLDLPFPEVSAPLIDAVGHIQSSTISTPGTGRQQLSELKEQVQEKGSALDKLTVDIVELVFDYIYSDHRLADPIKQQLLRLQVVAVKAALLDRSFFAKRQHPLRQVLDQITELGCDPDVDPEQGSELVTSINSIVTAIVTNFESDLVVFETALTDLESVSAQEETRRAAWLESKTAEGELEEKRVEALDEYRRVLSQRVDNHSPDFLREFLYRWWSPVLAAARVRPDAAFDEQRGLKLAEMLLWSVTPKQPDEVPKLASLLPQLITGVIKGLGMVECPAPEREVFFNELLKIHTRAIDAAKNTPTMRMDTPAIRSGNPSRPISNFIMTASGDIKFNGPLTGSDTAGASAPTVSLRDAIVDGLQRGMRLDVMEETGEINRYKLAWISPSKKLYLLSRYPHEPVSLSRNDVAAWLEMGKARVADDDSIIGKAIGAAANARPASLPVAA
jgi:Protein of unknown function (DUF1631)